MSEPSPTLQPMNDEPTSDPASVSADQPEHEHVIYDSEDAFSEAFGAWTEAPDGSSYWNDWPLDIDATIPVERVWTVVDGDSGAQWALPGGHLVNRVAYIVTEKHWPHLHIDGMVWDGKSDE